ncbi:MAG TPA: alpha/beta hydrolase-fold protein [Steroidobacteraceae bacterium]|nr:alpha/beta hydrolase-fold protein [Steroidobacteraceae bacterium]
MIQSACAAPTSAPTTAPATAPPDARAAAPVQLFGASQFDLPSKVSGRTYRIFVYKPLLPPPPAGYPVIYITDGNGLFPLAAAQMALMALAEKGALVIGVGYPAEDFMRPMMLRYRDLTPVTADKTLFPTQPPLGDADQGGGSELFYRFMTEELRPAVAASYPANPREQTLYGHSLGGLFVLGVMFKHPESFKNYVASSPSIWWDDKSVLKDEAAFVAKAKRAKTPLRVLICVGAKEQDPLAHAAGGLSLEDTNKRVSQARMVDNARELANRLAHIDAKSGFVLRFQDFSAEDHVSVIPASISRALDFALQQ